MYKLINNNYTGEVSAVAKLGEGWILSIPFNPDNTDYQEYLAWVAEGNEPLPADD